MDKSRFSKTDSRRAIMALAVVAMFLATVVSLSDVEAASPVSLSTDVTTFDIMEDGSVVVIISITSADTIYKKMDVFLDFRSQNGPKSDLIDFKYGGVRTWGVRNVHLRPPKAAGKNNSAERKGLCHFFSHSYTFMWYRREAVQPGCTRSWPGWVT